MNSWLIGVVWPQKAIPYLKRGRALVHLYSHQESYLRYRGKKHIFRLNIYLLVFRILMETTTNDFSSDLVKAINGVSLNVYSDVEYCNQNLQYG